MRSLTDAGAVASTTPQGRAITEALQQPTLCAAYQVTAAANSDRLALRTLGNETELPWSAAADRVRRIAGGLAGLGIEPGDTVALLLASCSEFHLLDAAALHIGAVPFSIYFSSPTEQIVPLIRNAEARVIVTQPQYLAAVADAARQVGALEHVVVIGDDCGEGSMTLAELERLTPAGFDLESAWRAVGPADLAAIIYTSGTTGDPKGAEWTHGALMKNLRSLHTLAPVSPGGRVVSYLPMAHLAERFISHYGTMAFGYTITSVPDPTQLAVALAQAHPTRFFGVPRIYEKIGAGARAIAAADPKLRAALDAGIAEAATHGGPSSAAVDPALALVRERLGLDQAEWLGAAAAPTRVDIHQLFMALGLPIAEIWGMSETALTLSNPPGAIKIGTVGQPLPGVEARVADDSELLIRGPIFSGYRKDPEKTREAFDEDEWLHTGDIATVDHDGYYSIVDRKKELIINSAGKNIPPAMVENRVKQHSPLIGHVVALGDRRSYLTALIILDPEIASEFAARHGLQGEIETLAREPAVRAEVDRAVAEANTTLARIEQVKRFEILPYSWAPGGDELTPTLKLRRRVIAAKYAREIEALYP